MSLYNPTYAARPDNTGLALFRYACHVDFDLIGRRLSIPIDINMFTDRLAIGFARKFVPSRARRDHRRHHHLARSGRARSRPARASRSTPLDRGGYPRPPASTSRRYADVRARYLYSLGGDPPGVGPRCAAATCAAGSRWAGSPINQTYFARPDNTGLALFRYAVHVEISFWNDHLALGLDAIMFTDKLASNKFRPSELDFTPELIGRFSRYEVHLAYERDMPIDQGGLIQQFIYLLGSVSF